MFYLGRGNEMDKIKYYFSPIPKQLKKDWEQILIQELENQRYFTIVYMELVESEILICIQ